MGDLEFTVPVNKPIRDPYGTLRKRKNEKTGDMEHYNHSGIDYKAEIGTLVQASEDGLVLRASFNESGGYGNVIVIYHNPGEVDSGKPKDKYLYTLYAHLNEMFVKPGDYVEKYERMAKSGDTGRSTGPHLHFEVIEANAELGWKTEGSMGVEGAVDRKNPVDYFNRPTEAEGTLPDMAERFILDRIKFVPDMDLKRKDPFRLQAYLDGKNIGYVNKYNDTIRTKIKYDLKGELRRLMRSWRRPLRAPESGPVRLDYEIRIR